MAYELTTSISPGVLWTHILIIGVATVGITETYKRWRQANKETNGVKKMILVSGFVTVLSASMQMPILFDLSFCPSWIGWFYNLITLGIAMVKFGHTGLVKVPEMMINKIMGVKSDDLQSGPR